MVGRELLKEMSVSALRRRMLGLQVGGNCSSMVRGEEPNLDTCTRSLSWRHVDLDGGAGMYAEGPGKKLTRASRQKRGMLGCLRN